MRSFSAAFSFKIAKPPQETLNDIPLNSSEASLQLDMNLISRAKLTAHLIFSSPSLARRPLDPHRITALQQCNFYSTRATQISQKSQRLTKPRTQKSSESSPSFYQRTKKQTEALTPCWPRPREIQCDAIAANSVNLIGHVTIPVRFESDSDGKHFATTVISLGDGDVERKSLSIPVVFEGELAHIVACHVKKDNRVFISGQLSVDPMRMVSSSESIGKFHVVVENLNFVEGLEENSMDETMVVSFSGMEIDKSSEQGTKKLDEVLDERDNDTELRSPSSTMERGNGEPIQERCGEKSWKGVSKKKDGDQVMDLWRDLVKNPLQWWDYRSLKANGLVKEKFPDFKQKRTGESLWLNGAPEWVLSGLGKLEFDVKGFRPKQEQGGEELGVRKRNGKFNDSWKNLAENPEKWWDNRMKKRNPKAPDFRHKETGEALWLDKSQACLWALTVKDGQKY